MDHQPHLTGKSQLNTYEDTSTAFSIGALAAKALDFAVRVHLVVFQDGHLDLLVLVLNLLRCLL